jgi:hypothetical protein
MANKGSHLPFFLYIIMKNLFSIGLICLAFSCAPKDELSMPQIISINPEENVDLKMSLPFKEVEYLLLKDNEEDRLVQPFKTHFHDEKIYIQDQAMNSLLVFDKEGTLIQSIKGEGKGPGEFFQMDDFQIKENSIFIQDTYLKKILEFNLDGEFVSEEKNLYHNTNFFKGNDFTLYFLAHNPDFGGFNFVKEAGGKKTGYLDIKEELENSIRTYMINGFTAYPGSEEIFYPIPHSYEVAVFDNKGNYIRSLEFNFGAYGVKPNDRKEHVSLINKKIDENNLVAAVRSVFPFESQLFLSFRQGKKGSTFLFLDKELNVQYQAKSFINDIDGMKIRTIPWTFSKDRVVFRVRSMDFYNDYLQSFANQKVNITQNNVHGFFQKNKEQLKDDNMILVSFILK